MKRLLLHILPIALFSAIYFSMNADCQVVPYYSIRPQGVDAARELVGWTQQINLACHEGNDDTFYGTMSITGEYTRSFNSRNIAQCLFGSSACNSACSDGVINISGSHVAHRGAADWFADYFYLPTDFQSTLKFNPVIENAIVDLDFYFGFDEWVHGLFFRINMPINWTRWDLGFCERVTSTGANDYDVGYFNSQDVINGTPGAPAQGIGIERSKLLNSFRQYASGDTLKGVTNIDSVTSTNAQFDPLCYAKIGCAARSTTQLADLSWILGWNFFSEERYHLGVGILTRAPTGNRPEGIYLFEPISGNGKHWELGAHITSSYTLWVNQEKDASLGFYLDANITHLFNTKQKRTFDLCGNPLSRYMLAEKFQPNVPITVCDPVLGSCDVTQLAGGDTNASGVAVITNLQFANEISPIANLTTRDVKVSVGVQGDVAAQLTYVRGGFNWDLGYNFWGRSCEKINCETDCCVTTSQCRLCPSSCVNACANVTVAPNAWGVKGDAYVYGFANIVGDTAFAIPLSATESQATIHAGTNFTQPNAFASDSCGDTSPIPLVAQLNPGVDNPQFAWTDIDGDPVVSEPLDIFNNPACNTRTSVNPILIRQSDVSLVGSRGMSHKVYTQVSYNWSDCDTWAPYIGIGGFGEFGMNSGCDFSSTFTNANNCQSSCSSSKCLYPSCPSNDCITCSLSQWGVWAKLGVSFD